MEIILSLLLLFVLGYMVCNAKDSPIHKAQMKETVLREDIEILKGKNNIIANMNKKGVMEFRKKEKELRVLDQEIITQKNILVSGLEVARKRKLSILDDEIAGIRERKLREVADELHLLDEQVVDRKNAMEAERQWRLKDIEDEIEQYKIQNQRLVSDELLKLHAEFSERKRAMEASLEDERRWRLNDVENDVEQTLKRKKEALEKEFEAFSIEFSNRKGEMDEYLKNTRERGIQKIEGELEQLVAEEKQKNEENFREAGEEAVLRELEQWLEQEKIGFQAKFDEQYGQMLDNVKASLESRILGEFERFMEHCANSKDVDRQTVESFLRDMVSNLISDMDRHAGQA